jgi:hypothetical protein
MGELVNLTKPYHWFVDDTPTIVVCGDELPTRAAQPSRPDHREVYLGTVVMDGVKRRVFRLGSYGRIEGLTNGLPLDGLKTRIPASERGKLEWNGPRFQSTLVDVPALPRTDVEDSVRIRLKCTGPAGCGVLVGLPTARVRADGPASEQIAMRAIEWVVVRPTTDPEQPRVAWRFQTGVEPADRHAASLVHYLDQFTGPYGRELAAERERISMAMASFDE